MKSMSPQPRKPRFRVGDRVRTVGPTVRPREINIGTVQEVISTAVDTYRYRVAFADGASEIVFGFELELIAS